MSFTPANYQQSGTLNKADAALASTRESERVAAIRKLELQMNAVDDTERRLGVDECWTPECAEYQHALQYLKNRRFIRVVERLEGLVVQRLFELSKANLMGTGKHPDILLEAFVIVVNRLQVAKTNLQGDYSAISCSPNSS